MDIFAILFCVLSYGNKPKYLKYQNIYFYSSTHGKFTKTEIICLYINYLNNLEKYQTHANTECCSLTLMVLSSKISNRKIKGQSSVTRRQTVLFHSTREQRRSLKGKKKDM